MALFIQNDAGTLGTGAVSALDAWVDIGIIANGDGNIGPASVPGRPELEQVTYSVQTQPGPPPARLFTLVNTNFGVNPQNIDIIVLACGAGFQTNDGMLVKGNALTMAPGAAQGGVVFNPSDSIVILYDTTQNDGAGICLKPQNGSGLTLATPNPVSVYHELSHAFRRATNSTLDTTELVCTDASPEESAAIVDENDMRDQLITATGGTPDASTRRDTNNHCGDSCGTNGAGPCCTVVASIASGSPYSADVQRLRQVRDGYLRRTRIGLEFFDRLHSDYYSFSPQICRLMARHPEIRQDVAVYFVQPLVRSLELVRDYTLNGCDPTDLGRKFLAAVEASPALSSLDHFQVLQALNVVRGNTEEGLPGEPLARLLRERARTSIYVSWALIEPLELFVDALLWRLDGLLPDELGRRLAAAMDQWGCRLPITEVWKDLSNSGLREELDFLNQALLRDLDARNRFTDRLKEYLS
jgi:hypothetical protein